MITNQDLAAINLSPTRKDFYQIWNELLDVAKKLSERWDPTSTNESDPGIVLLKVLASIADKLNYNIDKNILEAFMPSAAQEESMRKLTEMLGYNMRYYQSAVTEVRFSYIGEEKLPQNGLTVPEFMTIKNADGDVNYVVVYDDEHQTTISNDYKSIVIKCIEGQIVQCESDNNNIISINQIDDNNRYYLPETQIAENGIFIYNVDNGSTYSWTKVDNLNTKALGLRVYKVGFDSRVNLPYIQFPDDIHKLINDGLTIYYIRTSGINGNISARTLSTFELPDDDTWQKYDVTNFSVTNESATNNGKNIETITEAYNSFKKIIGTFDTLVTCRDYMNKIYQLVDLNNIPLVSNAIVSDIRSDINRAVTLCSFNEYGIVYVDQSVETKIKFVVNLLSELQAKTSSEVSIGDIGFVSSEVRYYSCKEVDNNSSTWELKKDYNPKRISNFDLILYPFKTVTGLNNFREYTDSFTLDTTSKNMIDAQIKDSKTISHITKLPETGDIICIKNYLKLNARITTINKVNIAEELIILSNIKEALYSAFNMRQLDFGEEIPFDSILEVIEGADARIKNVALDEPILLTKFMVKTATEAGYEEYAVASTTEEAATSGYTGRQLYNKLALRNILAGKVELFKYDNSFKPELSEAKTSLPNTILPTGSNKIEKFITNCTLDISNLESNPVKLLSNEVLQFRAPNYKTTITYPAYVNYFLKLKTDGDIPAKAATFINLAPFMRGTANNEIRWVTFNTYAISDTTLTNQNYQSCFNSIEIDSPTNFNAVKSTYGGVFIKDTTSSTATETYFSYISDYDSSISTYYYFKTSNDYGFNELNKWIKTQIIADSTAYQGLFIRYTATATTIGEYVDINRHKYAKTELANLIDNLWVQENNNNNYGIGVNGSYKTIQAGSEYQLKDTEFLCINYTPSSTSSADSITVTNAPINKFYGKGTIIKFTGISPKDSTNEHSLGHSWTKIQGFDFNGTDAQGQMGGMFTFNPNEQVEIRERVKIKLTDKITYLYWILNNTIGSIGLPNVKYTLEEGEYLFFTDESKNSLAYYGAGCELILNFVELKQDNENNNISAEDILSEGISAIPWTKFSFGENTNEKHIEIVEYQYVLLSTDDELQKIGVVKDPDTQSSVQEINSNKWYICEPLDGGIKYKFANDDNPSYLPNISVTDGEDAAYWEVRSLLALNTGPELLQTLKSTRDKITVVYENDTTDVIQSTSSESRSLKLNFEIQKVNNVYSATRLEYDNLGQPIKMKDFKCKIVLDKGDILKNTDYEVLDNDKIWIKVTGNRLPTESDPNGLILYTLVPDNNFGIIMIYLANSNETTSSAKRTHYITVNGTSNPAIAIYNNYNADSVTHYTLTNMQWWADSTADAAACVATATVDATVDPSKTYYKKSTTGGGAPGYLVDENGYTYTVVETPEANPAAAGYYEVSNSGHDKQYYLRPGINIIMIPSNVTSLRICKNTNDKDASIIFSRLDLIEKDTYEGIDVKRLGIEKESSGGLPANEIILKKIKDIDLDNTFYYNCPMDNSIAININSEALDQDGKTETLRTPRIWYDYNNVNNKFVISEIDAKYLATGIQIARSSKR